MAPQQVGTGGSPLYTIKSMVTRGDEKYLWDKVIDNWIEQETEPATGDLPSGPSSSPYLVDTACTYQHARNHHAERQASLVAEAAENI